MSDPTGTFALRRSFLAEGNRRLAQLRSLTHGILVEHDLMAARSTSLAQFLPNPGDRLAAFTNWFESTAERLLLGDEWWGRFLQRAYASGVSAGNGLIGLPAKPSHLPVPAGYRELAYREFAGLAASLTQQVTRAAANAALRQLKPGQMYRAMIDVLRKTAPSKMKAIVNTLTVQLHNAGRLAVFSAAGIAKVGIDPERLEPARASRFGHKDHAHGHVHFTDLTRVEIARQAREREAAELFAKQRRAAEREALRSERELERLRQRLERQIARQLEGNVLETTREIAQAELELAQARARAEVALAKAQTAVRETRAEAAWQKVITARKAERKALYPKPRPQEGPPRRVPEWVPPPGYEVVPSPQVIGTLAEPSVTTALPTMPLLNVLTAGDDKVCFTCQGLAEDGPYSIVEALGMLPAHPNCRCAFVPVFETIGETP